MALADAPNQNRDRKGADGAGPDHCTAPAPRSASLAILGAQLPVVVHFEFWRPFWRQSTFLYFLPIYSISATLEFTLQRAGPPH